MLIQVLKSKLNLRVTAANNECEGSITLDRNLMDLADLHPYERVEVNGKNTLSRIVTYVLEGERGSGVCELNGGAANHFNVGEEVHVNCFWDYESYTDMGGTAQKYRPAIVNTDKDNNPI